jgi:hypothetical protein
MIYLLLLNFSVCEQMERSMEAWRQGISHFLSTPKDRGYLPEGRTIATLLSDGKVHQAKKANYSYSEFDPANVTYLTPGGLESGLKPALPYHSFQMIYNWLLICQRTLGRFGVARG